MKNTITVRIKKYLLIILIFSGNTAFSQALVAVDSIKKGMEMENIEETFLDMTAYFRSKRLTKSDTPFIFPRKGNIQLPQGFEYEEDHYDVFNYIDSSYTQGLLVIQNDTIVYENYWRGQNVDTKHISWSVSKSFTSALIGIAIEEGYIKSVDESVDSYAAELKGSGFEGVSIKDVLEMSSGIGFDETYSDPVSDISRWWNGFMNGESQNEFVATLKNELVPGTFNRYVSMNTHVLGMILVKATGKSITEYMQEKLWDPLGAEFDAYWLTDANGMEMVLGGLNATLRDYAKLGQLYLHNGRFRNRQVVPAEWIKESVNPTEEHLLPNSKNSSSPEFGYGYQWWIPDGRAGEITAIGVFNQYIYINPTTKTVIVKNSANQNYYDSTNPYRSTTAHLELFRKIARQCVDPVVSK
ncbi:MAG: serine hydrolase [Bacteroidota bacterium]